MAGDHSKASGDYTYRRHRVCLALTDWHRFADALYDMLPEGRYFYNPPVVYRMWAKPPPTVQGEHMFRLYHAEGQLYPIDHSETEMHFDAHWQPEWFVTGDPINPFLPEPGSYWDLRQPQMPAFRFEFSFEKSAKDGHPEHVTDHGDYWFFYEPGNRAHMDIGRQVFRLFRQMATNRDQVTVGKDGAIRAYRRMSGIWLGHDAIAWARQDRTRLLAYSDWHRDPMGLRPLD
jgi:hypothetical protein